VKQLPSPIRRLAPPPAGAAVLHIASNPASCPVPRQTMPGDVLTWRKYSECFARLASFPCPPFCGCGRPSARRDSRLVRERPFFSSHTCIMQCPKLFYRLILPRSHCPLPAVRVLLITSDVGKNRRYVEMKCKPWYLIVRCSSCSFWTVPHPVSQDFTASAASRARPCTPRSGIRLRALICFSLLPKSKRCRCLPHHPPHDARLPVQRVWSHDQEPCIFQVCNA
jgi:hypothetical protein